MSRFVFLSPDGGETPLDPHSPASSARIHAIATHLREKVPPNSAVGLLYRSEPNLVIAWFAALVAGLRPLVMQYPTRKQSRAYWIDSVHNTVATAGLAGIVADDYCASLDLAEFPSPIAQADLDALPDAAPGPVLPEVFSIIQLSSGTTGYRKAMEFTKAALARHVADYNQVLGLVPGEDRIASWLPLYHDMGYIACFVMPILLGIDVVMMDPMDWVKQPEMLVTAIERHQATICYMPNFGFEVMARTEMPPLPSMRRWISCSEPVSAATAEKFLKASGAPADTFSPCYAMAENIFAVSIGAGFRTAEIDGVNVVSCGAPITSVSLKIVDGEIRVLSPTSIVQYMGGDDIRDAEGYYPTGDLGQVIDGELYVSGRKQDLLIQAGKKFILSDVDLRLNELRPEVRGRAVAIAVRDDRLGTETPTVLIETPDFFERTDAVPIAAELEEATGLDQIEVAFVPPRFLTKTSSGKFNRRKSRADWIAAREWRNATGAVDRDLVTEIRTSFPGVAWDQPVADVLDSLSLTVLRIILNASSVPFQRQQSLAEIVAALETAADRPAEAREEEGIRIVALSELMTIGRITMAHLDQLGQTFGCKVTLEHVCLPPSPVVLSDMIFYDYFQPRLDQAEFAAVSQAMARLKQASVIVTDDGAELFFLYESTYPALSHNLERDPRADLICFRWPDYTRHHHKLPLTVVSGLDLPLDASNTVLDQLSRYLGIPIFRIARLPGFTEFTREWEFQALDQPLHGVNPDHFVENFLRWAQQSPTPLARRQLPAGEPIVTDQHHCCSVSVSQAAVDRIVERYERFCVAGSASSVPYLRRALERAGKAYVNVPSYAEQILSRLDFEYDCLVICGAMGEPPADIDKPIIALQHIGRDWRTQNLGEFADEVGALEEYVDSGTDWLHLFTLERLRDYRKWETARLGSMQAIE